ncbi:MAG: hypothetical protein A2W99_11850 [Bacteroidetes bacterium GWF2_33_16]|nr:MAG: hypothetical protein A2X00_02425 [Bacteroidetes bacterium GWE2_32_14]OFY06392.1 MAG: hypothetical protein A2W99_11850 [Bacteroidetes bacterium GWF2_33_16]
MKTKFKLIPVFVLMLFVLSINAQEQKKVKIKMIKDINGKTTVIDTIIVGTDFKDIDLSGFHITKDMEEIIEQLESGEKKESNMKIYFTDSEKSDKCDSLKHVWIEVSDELDGAVKKVNYTYFITSDDDKSISSDKKVVYFTGNSIDKINIDTIIEKGSKRIIIKDNSEKGDDNVMVWVSAFDDETNLSDSGKTIKVKKIVTATGDSEKFDIFITSDENDKSSDEKSYNVVVKSGGDGTYKTVVMDGEEGDFYSNDDVIIIKSSKDSEKMIMMIKDISDEDKKILSEIRKDIKPENELKDIDIKIRYKVKDRKAILEFEVKNKSNLKVNIFDKSGKSSFSDEQKGFSGIYNKAIDLLKGVYYIQISVDKKTATKKLTIK